MIGSRTDHDPIIFLCCLFSFNIIIQKNEKNINVEYLKNKTKTRQFIKKCFS